MPKYKDKIKLDNLGEEQTEEWLNTRADRQTERKIERFAAPVETHNKKDSSEIATFKKCYFTDNWDEDK